MWSSVAAYLLLIILRPVLWSYALLLKQPSLSILLMQLFVSMVIGVVLSLLSGKIMATLAFIRRAPRSFAAVLALDLLSVLCVYLLDRLVTSETISRRAIPPVDNRMINAIQLMLLGGLSTWLFERQRPVAPRAVCLLGAGCTVLSVLCGLRFILPGLGPTPLSSLGGDALVRLLWNAAQVLSLQIIRSRFSTREVEVAGFLAWRYLIEFCALAAVVLFSHYHASPGATHFPSLPSANELAALATISLMTPFLAWFQYESVGHVSVATLTRICSVTPMFSYLIYTGVDRGIWRSRSFGMTVAMAVFALTPLLIRRAYAERGRPLWHGLRRNWGAYIGARILMTSIVSLGLPLLLFFPLLHESFDLRQRHHYLLLTLMPLSMLVFSVGLIARLVDQVMKHRFDTAISLVHGMKTPFTMMSTLLGMMRSSPVSPQSSARYLDDIERRCAHAQRLVKSMLDEAREAQIDRPLRLDREVVDPRALLTEARDSLCALLIRDTVRLTLQVQGVAPDATITVDRDRVILVLTNLTENSLHAYQKHTGGSLDQLRIEWHAETRQGELLLCVRDNGPGLPQWIARSAVEAWMSPDGNGVGLYLCQRYIEAHGGRFALTNREEGGCEARIALPLDPSPEEGVP